MCFPVPDFTTWLSWLTASSSWLIDGLNRLQGLLIVFFTAILVIYNRGLTRETRLLRKRETEPKLEVYLIPYEGSSVLINMVVRNVGGGAARDIRWQIDADEADLDAHEIKLHKMALFKVLHYLPSQEKIVFFFGSAPKILQEPKLKQIKIEVTYKNDALRNEQSDSFVIDLQPMVGLVTIGTPPQFEIARSLQEISKNLDHAISGFKKPLVRVIDESDFQCKEVRDREEAMKQFRRSDKQTKRSRLAAFLRRWLKPNSDRH